MTGEFDERVEAENTDRSPINFGRGSQVVRHGSAKAVFVGSIPTLASKISETLPCQEMRLKGGRELTSVTTLFYNKTVQK